MKQVNRIFRCVTAALLSVLLLTACSKPDLEKSTAMGGYLDKAENAASNTVASAMYQAATAALRDMDAEGVDLSLLAGDYALRSSDLTTAVAPQMIVNTSDAVTKLWSSMENYLDQTVTFDKALVSVKDGVCAGVAVQTDAEYDSETGETVRQFGCYPNALSMSDSYQKLEDVLAHAKG